ncbi:MAG: extracellular solute-binding protein [Sphaerochaetaceae bacterium]|nr:extracellular solute-binding protein [Spirochaetaceae bacterium]MDY6344548.1 extracellular solute-binding protein [Sphaerochaetaceae bacterium]
MKKCLVFLTALVAVSAMLFAQGGSEAPKSAASSGAPAETNKLVVYATCSESEAQKITDAFIKKYPGMQITIIQAGSGDMVTRVKTEWPKPEGDVVLLLAKENLDSIYNNLAPYKSANHDDFAPEFRDPAETPRYYATSLPLQAFMYNTKMLTPDQAPKSWKDLADPKFKGEIVLGNPASSGSSYAQLYMMHKLYGMDFVRQVASNATYVASSTAGPDSVARGEYAITVTGEKNIGDRIAQGDPVAYVLPEEGTGLRTEGSAILANCKNLASAQHFIDFITSKEGMTVVRDQCFRRPALTTIAGPANLPSLKDMKFFDYDAKEAAASKKQLVSEFQGLL